MPASIGSGIGPAVDRLKAGCSAIELYRPLSAGRGRLLLSTLLRHGRQVPALIAVFEPSGTGVALQRATEVVRPGRQSKFAREIVKEFVRAGAP